MGERNDHSSSLSHSHTLKLHAKAPPTQPNPHGHKAFILFLHLCIASAVGMPSNLHTELSLSHSITEKIHLHILSCLQDPKKGQH